MSLITNKKKKRESGEEGTIKFTVEKIKSTVERLGTIKLNQFYILYLFVFFLKKLNIKKK